MYLHQHYLLQPIFLSSYAKGNLQSLHPGGNDNHNGLDHFFCLQLMAIAVAVLPFFPKFINPRPAEVASIGTVLWRDVF
jgi:hypothetical protein